MEKAAIAEALERELSKYELPRDVKVHLTTFRIPKWRKGWTTNEGLTSCAVREVVVRTDRHGDPVYRLEFHFNVNPHLAATQAKLDEALRMFRETLIRETGATLPGTTNKEGD